MNGEADSGETAPSRVDPDGDAPPPRGEKIDVGPWLAAAALIVAVAALGASIVALDRGDGSDNGGGQPGSQASGGMAMGGGHGAGHMGPLPIDGITRAPSDRGGAELKGVRRDGALEFKLDARPVWWRLYGKRRVSAWAYNGIVPGPQIRVRNGERVRIRFTNRLPDATTVHWHGIDVPNSQDGVPGVTQRAIAPGASYTYEFTARPAGDPRGSGTFLYHSHADEDRQMAAGLAGAFIIDPPATSAEGGAPAARRYDVERTLVVSEMTADAASGRVRGAMQMEGMMPNFFTINGKSFPDTEPIKVRAGRRVLLRLVNAGQFAHPLHLHGTAFRVVARSGHPARDTGLLDTITLESSERADIAFTLPPGRWLFHCHIGHHLTNDGAGPGGLITVVEAS